MSKQPQLEDGYVIYNVVLVEDDIVLGQTSRDFSWDLSQAIKRIKGLSNRRVYEHLYPSEFRGIYITDISSEIAIMRGFEKGVTDFGGLTTWNSIQIEGYARAKYN